MDSFPAFFPLSGARVAIAGGGEAAEAKARLFEGSPAQVVRLDAAQALDPQAYAGARLAFIADQGAGWAERAGQAARAAGALVNVVDQPALSDFYTPAIVDRGAVVGAVGTTGQAPILGTELRSELEARWPEGLGRLARFLAEVRPEVARRFPHPAARRGALRALVKGEAARLARQGDLAAAHARAAEELDTGGSPPIVSVLRPPPSVDLLTLGAVRALAEADRIVVVGAPAHEVLSFARRDAPTAHVSIDALPSLTPSSGRTVIVSTEPLDPERLAHLGRLEPLGG